MKDETSRRLRQVALILLVLLLSAGIGYLLSAERTPAAAPEPTITVSPAPAATGTASATASPAPAKTHTPEPGATSTATPSLTPTMTATASRTPLPAALPVLGAAKEGVRARTGPGLGYPVLGILPEGELREILGRNETGTWLYLEFQCQTYYGWVYADLIDLMMGDPAALPVLDAPPVPKTTATPRPAGSAPEALKCN